MAYTDEQKKEARTLYFAGLLVPEIARKLSIEKRTLYHWIKEDDWNVIKAEDPDILIRQRIAVLLTREEKTVRDMEELSRLLTHVENLHKLRYEVEDRKEKRHQSARQGADKRKAGKNDFTVIDEADLKLKFLEGLFGYQLDCFDHIHEKLRNILKSRQIGMTWYFAREAFFDALMTGHNKLFISATRAQAGMFRRYICKFAKEWFDVELVGKDEILLHTPHGDASLRFLATSARSAQSYNGDLYIDEYFWIPQFKELKELALGMSSQITWRVTLFSTPSSKGHPAYKYWSGDEFNERMKRANKPLILFPDEKELSKGAMLCPDRQWRKVISIDDALAAGCNLFNLEEIKIMFSEDEFDRLFLCKFIEGGRSCFRFADLQKCLGDSAKWNFFHPDDDHPYLGKVWIGYDPSRNRDNACIVVMAPPVDYKGKFHVLEKIILRKCSWEYQAATIKTLCKKYDVDYIGIDTTGPGSGVFESVQRFFPAATAIQYSLETKSKMVLKAQAVIESNRILWDSAYSDIAAGFLLIHSFSTGNNIGYKADRSDETGHADAAWAVMHCLLHEELIMDDEQQKCILA